MSKMALRFQAQMRVCMCKRGWLANRRIDACRGNRKWGDPTRCGGKFRYLHGFATLKFACAARELARKDDVFGVISSGKVVRISIPLKKVQIGARFPEDFAHFGSKILPGIELSGGKT